MIILWSVIALSAGVLFPLWISFRHDALEEIRKQLRKDIDRVRDIVNEVHEAYVETFPLRRTEILRMVESATKEPSESLFRSALQRIDKLLTMIISMRRCLDHCDELLAKASVLRLSHARNAKNELYEHRRETYIRNRYAFLSDGFDSHEVTVEYFATDVGRLRAAFVTAKNEWTELLKAVDAQKIPVEDHFPRTTYNELCRLCDSHAIPRSRLSRHPLSKTNETPDFYSRLDVLLTKNPVEFANELRILKQDEENLVNEINELVKDMRAINRVRVYEREPLQTLLDPEDDPWIELVYATDEQRDFYRLLASTASVTEVHVAALKLIERYTRFFEMYERVTDTLASIQTRVVDVESDCESARETLTKTTGLLTQISEKHSDTNGLQRILTAASQWLELGIGQLEQTKAFVREERHMRAFGQLKEALFSFSESMNLCAHVTNQGKKLDQLKDEYLSQRERMGKMCSLARTQLKTYGAPTQDVPEYAPVVIVGPEDYEECLGHLQQDCCELDNRLDRAREAWELANKKRRMLQAYRQELMLSENLFSQLTSGNLSLTGAVMFDELDVPSITNDSTIEEIQAGRRSLTDQRELWELRLHNHRYTDVIERKRRRLLKEFRDRLNHVVQLHTSNCDLLRRYGVDQTLPFIFPEVSDVADVVTITNALMSMENQVRDWHQVICDALQGKPIVQYLDPPQQRD